MNGECFHISDILSITTGRLLSITGMDGIYRILEFLEGREVVTHQIPELMRECAPWLIFQHPALAHEIANDVNEENLALVIKGFVDRHGKRLAIIPLQKAN